MPNIDETIYLSEYTGETVDEAVGVTLSKEQYWDNKVDKIPGKGLSTNDYTSEEKTKLANLNTLMSGITNITTTVQNNNTTVPTGKAILDAVSDLGGGDMMRSSYDTTNTGNKVDTAIVSELALRVGSGASVDQASFQMLTLPSSGANDSSNHTGEYCFFLKMKNNTGTGNNSGTVIVINTQNFTVTDPDIWILRAYCYRSSFYASVQLLSKADGATLPNFGYIFDEDDNCYYVGIRRPFNYSNRTKVYYVDGYSGDGFKISPSPLAVWRTFDTEHAPENWTLIPFRGTNLIVRRGSSYTTLESVRTTLLQRADEMASYSANYYAIRTASTFDNPLFSTSCDYLVRIFKASNNTNQLAITFIRGQEGGEQVIHMSRVNSVWQDPVKIEEEGKIVRALNSDNADNASLADVATKSNLLAGTDTRSANSDPSSYYSDAGSGGSRKVEFKSASAVGLPTSGIDKSRVNYWSVETNIAWSNSSGSRPVQIASSEKTENSIGVPLLKARTATNDDTWSNWFTLALRERDMNRTTPVNSSDTNLSTVMARGIYAGTTDMTAGVTSLPAGVIYLVFEE